MGLQNTSLTTITPRHFTTTPPNAYLLQFLSRVHHAQISVKNYKATERQKTYFEETEQASEPDKTRNVGTTRPGI